MVLNELQDAYECTVIAGGGLRNLRSTAWEFVKACLRPAVEPKCLLVNPSIVGVCVIMNEGNHQSLDLLLQCCSILASRLHAT